MPIILVTNYLTPNQTALFSRLSDTILTYSRLESRRQWSPLKAKAKVKDVSPLCPAKRLYEICRELNNPLNGAVISGSSRSPEFWCSIAFCRLRRTPFAVWLERPRSRVTWLRRKALRIALGKNGRILAVGTTATIRYRQFIPGVEVNNFPYTYGRRAIRDLRVTVPNKRVTERRTTALFIGAEWERKGLDIFLKAVAAMPQNLQSRLALRVAGLKALPPELEQIVKIPCSAWVTYLGFLQPDDVQNELSSADVLVVPSRYDGWAVVVEEAMAEGTPVIASDEVGAAADLVLDGHSGFVFPSGDAEALAAALTALMCRDDQGRSLSVGAMTIVAQHRDKYNIESLELAVRGGLKSPTS
jgi:glycosyltransferase involved in cell wall biosynthesis